MKRKCLFCKTPVDISKDDVSWKCINKDCQGEGGLESEVTSIYLLIIDNSKPSEELLFFQGVLVLVSALALASALVSIYFIWRSRKLTKEILTKDEELRRYATIAKKVLQTVEETNDSK